MVFDEMDKNIKYYDALCNLHFFIIENALS